MADNIFALFDQSRKNENNSYGEAVRLSNELRAVKEHQIKYITPNIFGREELKTINIPSKWGFDCETALYNDFILWWESPMKKSESLFWFVIRVMCCRFPEKHTEIRNRLTLHLRKEFDIILSQLKREIEWIGTVGYSNMVRLDGSLTKPFNRVVKLKNDKYKIIKK